MKKFFRGLFYVFCSIVAVLGFGTTILVAVLYFFSAELPDHSSLRKYSPDLASRVFLQDGTKLCEYATEKRYFIPINKIPQKLINAFIAAEDKHFFEHKGIDISGIARSFIKNIGNLKSGKRPHGASTITQQIARIFLIKNNEISYLRKLKEAILSIRIESALTKTQILELYLNQIYMGCGTYGVAAAAKLYFNKTVDELSLGECAYLAALPKGANNYHPIKHKSRAIDRRNWVITRQLEDGYISQEEADSAYDEDLIMAPNTSDETSEYFAEEIRKYLIEKLPYKLSKDGMIIRATIDSKLQKCAYSALRNGLEKTDRGFEWRGPIAHINITPNLDIKKQLNQIATPFGGEHFQKAVVLFRNNKSVRIQTTDTFGEILEKDVEWAVGLRSGDIVLVSEVPGEENKGKFVLKQVPKVQGAIVVIETQTGRILAMQGGYSFDQSQFNRATQAYRQIGSAFKPFVYLAGLENGFEPNSVIDSGSVEIDLGERLGVWKPRNYKDKVIDKITFRRAIERSVNTATVRIAQEVGMKKIANIAQQFGVFENMPPFFSYALGAGETTLLKLTTAYAMFANGGKRICPTIVDYVQDKHGNTIYKSVDQSLHDNISYDAMLPPKLLDTRAQISDEQTIYQLTSLLIGVMRRGSGARASMLQLPIAGKTGTSNDSKDTWFIGYTPDIAVGVFVGFDDISQTLGEEASGTATALPIFIEFMQKARPFLKIKPFNVPKGIKQIRVDADTGQEPTEATIATIFEAFKEDSTSVRKTVSKQNLISTDNTMGTNETQQINVIY